MRGRWGALVLVAAMPAAAQELPFAGRTDRPAWVRLATPDVVWFRAGPTRVGADAIALDHAITLCRRDLRRYMARLGAAGAAYDEGYTANYARIALTLCFRRATPLPCTPGSFAREAGARDVWLSAFGIDRTEVSVDAYARCVRAGACAEALDPPGTPHTGAPTQPVTGVTWRDADAYCRWVGARLPTDAEWERAARGREARPFPWGAQWDGARANHGSIAPECRDESVDGFALAAPVGSFPGGATPEGVLDLAGNVQEWVFDRAEVGRVGHPPEPAVDPRGPETGGERVVRGGSYAHPPWALRTTWRDALGAGERRRDTGFRCAWDPR